MKRKNANSSVLPPRPWKRAIVSSVALLGMAASCRTKSPAAPDTPSAASEAGDAGPRQGSLAEFTDVVAIAASVRGRVACALRSDGSIWCWGAPPCSRSDDRAPAVASRVALDAKAPAVQIAVGREFSCARLLTGAVWCWGDTYGSDALPYEVLLPAPATDVTVEQRGPIDAFVRLADGRVIVWTRERMERPFATELRLQRARGEWSGGCEQDLRGGVRCRGTSEGGGAPGRGALSDGQWRAVPGLANARELGADDFCGWGIVERDVVRQDCVYGDCCVPYFPCADLVTSRRDYASGQERFHRLTLEYRFPFVRRLVTADVGLDDDGRCYHFDGQQILATSDGPYADMVGGPDAYEGLRSDHRVRRFCGPFPEGEGTPVLVSLADEGP